MLKIKVYNISNYIENKFTNKRLYNYAKGIAIIEGREEVLIFDHDGIGWVDNIDTKVELQLTDIPKEKHIFANAQYEMEIDLKEIIEEVEYTEMLITEFLNRYKYNKRLRQNFLEVLGAIDKIGLKSKEYYNSKIDSERCVFV